MNIRHRCHAVRMLLLVSLIVAIGTLLLTGSVAADGGDFEVEITSVPNEVDADGDLDVSIEVTNDGKKDAQNITLEDSDGNVQDEINRTLNPSESITTVLTWENVPGQPTREITPTVRSDVENDGDNLDFETVAVLWSSFEIREATVTRSNIVAGEGITFDINIENIGTKTEKKTVYLNESGNTIASKSIELTGQANTNEEYETTVEFPNIKSPNTRGEYTYDIETEDDSESIDVAKSGEFGVTIDDTSTDGTNLTVEATFSKLGAHTDTRTVDFIVDSENQNEVVKQKEVTVEGEESTTTFSYDTGSLTFTKDISIETDRPDFDTTRIVKTDDRDLGPSEFTVGEIKYDKTIETGDDLTVVTDVENIGSNNATQTVTLENQDGDAQNQTEVVINKGQTKSVELTWEDVSEVPPRGILPTIRIENKPDTPYTGEKYVNVLDTQFEIRELSVDRQSVPTEEDIQFTAAVRNIGTKKGEQNISLLGPSGNEIDIESKVELDAKDQITIELDATAPEEPGEYTYTVESETPDQTETQTVTTGAFNVEIEDTIVDGSNIIVDGIVSKQGSYTDTQPVELVVDGNTEDTKEVTLEGNTPKSKTFTANTDGTFPKTIKLRTQQPDVAISRIEKANIAKGPRIDSVNKDVVQSGDSLRFTYTADGPNVNGIQLVVIGPRGEEVITGQSLTPGEDRTGTITIPGRDVALDGKYKMRMRVTDDFGAQISTTRNNAFAVSNAINPEAIGELAPTVYTPAGDFVEITTGGEYMLIGGSTEGDESNQQQYLDILRVTGGSTTLNTRRIGTTASSESAYGSGVTSYAHTIGADSEPKGEFSDVTFEDENGNEIASTLAEFRSEVGVGPRSAPLQADRYRLVAGENGRIIVQDDGEPDFRRPVGRSNVVLTQSQELGDITTYVAPPGDVEPGGVPGDAVESDFVAKGERVYITVPAVGMWGAMFDDGPDNELTAERIKTLLEREEGVHMDLSVSRYGSPNSRDATLQFEEGNDLAVSVDDTVGDWESDTLGDPPNFGGFTIGIDTRGSEPFTHQPQDGDVLTFEIEYQSPDGERFRYQDYSMAAGEQPPPFEPAVEPEDGVEHFPYFGPSDTTISSNASFEYQDLSIRYDRTRPNGDLLVPAESGAVILGSTTMAPGSPVSIEIVANERNPEPITINDITIDDDRRFSTTADFSTLEPGDEAEIEFYAQNRQLDNRIVDQRTVRVVDDIENPATFEIDSLPQNVTLQQRESLAPIQANITNTGSIVGQQLVNFTIEGEPIREETIILEDGQSETLDLSGQFVTLPIGTYEYTVKTENDEATGQLTVTPPDSGTTITSADSDAATSSSPLGEDEMPSDGDDSEDGLFGLLGIRSRDVVVATAVTGAVHVLGYWA